MSDAPQVFVGLYLYPTIGEWVTLDGWKDDNLEAIAEAGERAKAKAPDAEEYGIMDSEGMPRVVGIDEAAAWGGQWKEDPDQYPLVLAVADDMGMNAEDAGQYHEDNYRGSAPSKEEFAEQLAYDFGYMEDVGTRDANPLLSFIDWEGFARSLEYDMNCEYVDGEYHYWWRS